MSAADFTLIEKLPSVADYLRMIESVGFKRRDPEAVERALARSDHGICAVVDGEVVGFARITGDGGLHYYITDVIVHRDYQRRGIGTAIVARLMEYFDGIPYENTVIGVFPVKGLADFYARHGFVAQKAHSPAMLKWINEG